MIQTSGRRPELPGVEVIDLRNKRVLISVSELRLIEGDLAAPELESILRDGVRFGSDVVEVSTSKVDELIDAVEEVIDRTPASSPDKTTLDLLYQRILRGMDRH